MATAPFHRYKQIWSQLTLVNKVLCRHYSPGPSSNTVTIPVLPKSLQSTALRSCHDDLSGGHMGYEKTLYKLWQEAYWVNMSQDVEQYCRQCNKCNASKPPINPKIYKSYGRFLLVADPSAETVTYGVPVN